MTLSAAVTSAVGQPSSVRIGVVTAIDPLRVNVQGTEYADLGVIGAPPPLGATVALLGQSTSVASSPTSWLVLGAVYPSQENVLSPWVSYPMVWTSSTPPNPTVGAGTLSSRYVFVAHKTVLVEIGLVMGAGFNAGGGRWFFSAPFESTVAATFGAAGGCYIFDNGTANRAAVVSLTTSPTGYFVTAAPSGDVGLGVPQVWAVGDALRFSITHEIA